MSNRNELLDSYKAGNFLEKIYEFSLAEGDDDALISELVALHNEGLIDVVEAFKALKSPSSRKHIFS